MIKVNKVVFACLVLPLMTLLPAEAHAASEWSMEGDFSFKALRFIFGDIINVITGGVTPERPDSMLGAISEVYNSAMIGLAFIIFGFNGISGLLASSEQGVFLGKNVSSMFAGFRTVFAFSFLMPFKSGYSAMQIFVLMVAGQGIHLGSAMSNAAIEHIETTGSLYPPPFMVDTEQMALNLLLSNACRLSINKVDSHENIIKVSEIDDAWFESISYSDSINEEISDSLDNNQGVRTYLLRFDSKYSAWNPLSWFSNGYTNIQSYGDNACGLLSIEFPTIQSDSTSFFAFDNYFVEYIENVKTLDFKMNQLATQVINARDNEGVVVDPSLFMNAVKEFNVSQKSAIQTFSEDIMKARKQEWEESGDTPNMMDDSTKKAGWMGIFGFYWEFIRLNKETHSIINAMPSYREMSTAIQDKEDISVFIAEIQTYINLRDVELPDGSVSSAERQKKLGKGSQFEIGVNDVASSFGIAAWYSKVLVTNPDPVIGVSTYAQTMLTALEVTVYSKIMLEIKLKLITEIAKGAERTARSAGVFSVVGTGIANAAVAGFETMLYVLVLFTRMLFFLALIVAPFLALLAYYIPMVPFIYGTMGSLGWLILVIESVAAAPLWAAGHAFVDGEGLVSQRVQQGYMILLNLFTRPALMIIGFFASLLVLTPISQILHPTFYTAFNNVTSEGIGFAIETIAYIVILTVVYMQLVHRCFNLIISIPNNVTRFIGGGQEQLGEVEDEGRISTVIAGHAKFGNKVGADHNNNIDEAHQSGKGAIERLFNGKPKPGDDNGGDDPNKGGSSTPELTKHEQSSKK